MAYARDAVGLMCESDRATILDTSFEGIIPRGPIRAATRLVTRFACCGVAPEFLMLLIILSRLNGSIRPFLLTIFTTGLRIRGPPGERRFLLEFLIIKQLVTL